MQFGTTGFCPSANSRRGQILSESLWILFWFGVLVLGAVVAVNRYWNHRLGELQKLRLPYDGIRAVRSP